MRYNNLENGLSDLKKGVIWSLFHIDKNFSEELVNLYFSGKKPLVEYSFQNYIHIYSDNTSMFFVFNLSYLTLNFMDLKIHQMTK
jgi:hypothetical protein